MSLALFSSSPRRAITLVANSFWNLREFLIFFICSYSASNCLAFCSYSVIPRPSIRARISVFSLSSFFLSVRVSWICPRVISFRFKRSFMRESAIEISIFTFDCSCLSAWTVNYCFFSKSLSSKTLLSLSRAISCSSILAFLSLTAP